MRLRALYRRELDPAMCLTELPVKDCWPKNDLRFWVRISQHVTVAHIRMDEITERSLFLGILQEVMFIDKIKAIIVRVWWGSRTL